MNEILSERLNAIKHKWENLEESELLDVDVEEEYNIDQSYHWGGSTLHARNRKVQETINNAHNKWRKVGNSKGRKLKFQMILHLFLHNWIMV